MIDIHVKIKSKTTTFIIAVFTIAVLLLIITTSTASAATITVDGSGGAMYNTIQGAVNDANNGDIIQVAAGTYYEHVVVNKSVTLQGESNSTTIIEGSGSEIVIEVTVDWVMIDGFTIQNGSSGIFVTSSNNVFSNNSITNIFGANSVSGGAGGIGSGIYLSGSTNNTFTSNTISNITGGNGGMAGDRGSGGFGGIGSGIYLSGSTNNTLTSNTINNVTGGIGGKDIHAPSDDLGGIGGDGGIGSGIYLSGSTDNSLTFNTISNITGGTGGTGYLIASAGGIGSGIYLSGCSNNILTSNTISIITSGPGACANTESFGGPGSLGSGIYLLDSTNNTLTFNTISNITGGPGVSGDLGGLGGTGSGIYLSNSTSNFVNSNTISNMIGGTAAMGLFHGGAGGIGSGIYLSDSSKNTLTSNTISNIIGGTGASGGFEGEKGADGTGYSIYLNTSTLNLLFHNNLQNVDKNGYDDGSNSWDNGYPSGGNYWSDYNGIDANADGIGDTPYNNISGSAGAQDRYPLMEPWNEDNISIQLNSGWNLISAPLNLTTWELGQESIVGDPLNITPENSLSSIYRYNTTSESFEMCIHQENWGWEPATGSEGFTELEPGRGYWVVADNDCTLTFTGTTSSDLDMSLDTGWNCVGWYSTSEAELGQESVVIDPLNVTPDNSLSSIYRYNTTSESFEMCIHHENWGWESATRSENFIELEPGKGYWVMADNDCEWKHET